MVDQPAMAGDVAQALDFGCRFVGLSPSRYLPNIFVVKPLNAQNFGQTS
jgi:hypothetical protein